MKWLVKWRKIIRPGGTRENEKNSTVLASAILLLSAASRITKLIEAKRKDSIGGEYSTKYQPRCSCFSQK
jgi:hypothetical protein